MHKWKTNTGVASKSSHVNPTLTDSGYRTVSQFTTAIPSSKFTLKLFYYRMTKYSITEKNKIWKIFKTVNLCIFVGDSKATSLFCHTRHDGRIANNNKHHQWIKTGFAEPLFTFEIHLIFFCAVEVLKCLRNWAHTCAGMCAITGPRTYGWHAFAFKCCIFEEFICSSIIVKIISNCLITLFGEIRWIEIGNLWIVNMFGYI